MSIMTDLEDYIAARRAEGASFVVIDKDGGCIGWGGTIDAAWEAARWEHPDHRVADSECYSSEPNGPKVEDWDAYQERSATDT
jgi:hypothetical protein